MDVEALREYCLSKPGTWPDFPWEHEYPVIKVGPGESGKIFAFLGAEGVGVKGGPTREVADEWIHRYPDDASVMRYIGRSGWNDLTFSGAIPDEDLLEAGGGAYPPRRFKTAEKKPAGGRGAPPPAPGRAG